MSEGGGVGATARVKGSQVKVRSDVHLKGSDGYASCLCTVFGLILLVVVKG